MTWIKKKAYIECSGFEPGAVGMEGADEFMELWQLA